MLENHQFHQHLGVDFQHVGFSWYLSGTEKARMFVHVSGMCFFGYAWDFFFWLGWNFGWENVFGVVKFCGEDIFVYKCFIK